MLRNLLANIIQSGTHNGMRGVGKATSPLSEEKKLVAQYRAIGVEICRETQTRVTNGVNAVRRNKPLLGASEVEAFENEGSLELRGVQNSVRAELIVKKEKTMCKQLLFIVSSLILSAPAVVAAEEYVTKDHYTYFQVQLGNVDYEYAAPGFTNLDGSDRMWSIGGGAFSKNFGGELAWTNYGNVAGTVRNRFGVPFTDKIGLTALNMSLTPHFDFWRVTVYGKVGGSLWSAKETFNGVKDEDSGIALVYGVGLKMHINHSLAIAADYETLSGVSPEILGVEGDLDVSGMKLGVMFKF